MALKAEIDRDSPVPLYYQLQQILLREIEWGQLVPGQPLPTEKELEKRYGLSRTTVRRALDEIARAGYITRERGRGTFVAVKLEDTRSEKLRGFVGELMDQGVSVGCQVLFDGSMPAPPRVAKQLGMEPGTLAYLIQRVELTEGQPFTLTELWLAVEDDLGISREELTEKINLYAYLESLLLDRYGIILAEGEKTLEATLCMPEEAELLETAPGAPLLLARFIIRSREGKPVIYIKVLYRGDRYIYSAKLST